MPYHHEIIYKMLYRMNPLSFFFFLDIFHFIHKFISSSFEVSIQYILSQHLARKKNKIE